MIREIKRTPPLLFFHRTIHSVFLEKEIYGNDPSAGSPIFTFLTLSTK